MKNFSVDWMAKLRRIQKKERFLEIVADELTLDKLSVSSIFGSGRIRRSANNI